MASETFDDWQAEWPIEHVETWFEFGDVGSFMVTQAQGERPRVSWTVPTKAARERSVRAQFDIHEQLLADEPPRAPSWW